MAFRLARALTKAERAERAGCPVRALSDDEAGDKAPKWPAIVKLVRALEAGLVALGVEESPAVEEPARPVRACWPR